MRLQDAKYDDSLPKIFEARRVAAHPPMTEPDTHRSTLIRILFAAGLATAFAWCVWLASQHPLQPIFVLSACCLWTVVSALRPGLWLFAVPAALPIASLAPWTGWLIFDEFDLLVAGSVAGGFLRLALRPDPSPSPMPRSMITTAIVFAGLGVLGAVRGVIDAGAFGSGLFQGYTDAGNSIRMLKPVVYALLVLPLLRRSFQDSAASALAVDRLVRGMLFGLCVVLLATLHERAAYPGLLDFSSHYRTVALFWEMHVGGAAIDAYLAITAPFVVWALWSARSGLGWAAAAVLALLTEYVCLTTFSRGVYVAVFGSLAVLAVHLARRRHHHHRDRPPFRVNAACSATLLLAMLLQVFLVLGSESFMLGRIGGSERDLRGRIAHWQQGLNLLKTPADWVLGVGLGRLPARYAASARGGEFPGTLTIDPAQTNPAVRLAGPRSLPTLGGLYGLTQRVSIEERSPLTASFDVRAGQATRLRVSVCEMHLLYERRCQAAQVHIEPTAGAWRPMSFELEGPRLDAGAWYARRTGVFSVSVLDANSAVELDNLSLKGNDGIEQLRNRHFAQQLASWFPVARNQFLAWHIDNLYLELLIERGLFGLAAFLLLAGFTAWRLGFGPARGNALSPFLLASLAGAMTVGLVSSIMDVPRVAFALFLMVLVSLLLKPE